MCLPGGKKKDIIAVDSIQYQTNVAEDQAMMRRTWNSCGCSLPSLALVARAETSALMAESPLVWALNTIGVIRPLAVLTATLTSTTWFLRSGENYGQ